MAWLQEYSWTARLDQVGLVHSVSFRGPYSHDRLAKPEFFEMVADPYRRLGAWLLHSAQLVVSAAKARPACWKFF
jgi:hypothetical protein